MGDDAGDMGVVAEMDGLVPKLRFVAEKA